MSSHLFALLADGRKYMKVWPQQNQLNALFPETRVIKATELATHTMPLIAIFVAGIQISYFGSDFVPQAIAIAAFFVSLPLQGVMWLGYRSQQNLPPFLAHWYREIQQKMRSSGRETRLTQIKPRYFDLAKLLKMAFDEMDKSFTREIF